MSEPRPIRFTRPDILRSLAPELLRELLERFPAFMATAGLDLDALGSQENRFAACGPLLAELLNNDPTTPTALVEVLFIISVPAARGLAQDRQGRRRVGSRCRIG